MVQTPIGFLLDCGHSDKESMQFIPPSALLVTTLSKLSAVDLALSYASKFAELELDVIRQLVSQLETGIGQVSAALDQVLSLKFAQQAKNQEANFHSLSSEVIQHVNALDAELSQRITAISHELNETEAASATCPECAPETAAKSFQHFPPETFAEQVSALCSKPQPRTELGRKLAVGNLQQASVLARKSLITANILPECERILRLTPAQLAPEVDSEIEDLLTEALNHERQANGLLAGIALQQVAQRSRRIEALIERILVAPAMPAAEKQHVLAHILLHIQAAKEAGTKHATCQGCGQATRTLAIYKLDQLLRTIQSV